MNNAEMMQRRIKEFTRDLHVTVKSMEKLGDTLSYVKKHPETDKDLARAETIRAQTVAIGDALLLLYNMTLTNLQ